MLLGLDRERFERISAAGSNALSKLTLSASREEASFEALNKIIESTSPAPSSVVDLALKAAIIERATDYTDLLLAVLQSSAEQVASEPGNLGEIIPLPDPDLGLLGNSPTFRQDTAAFNLIQTAGVNLGFTSLLSHIERGDQGLVSLLKLPGRSIRIISSSHESSIQNRIHIFPTQIEGLEIGIDPQIQPPHLVYFSLPQLGSKTAVLNRKYRP